MRQTPLLALAALFAAACSGTRLAAPSPEPRAPRPAVIRGTPAIPSTWTLKATPVTAPHAMVVTAHPVATQAGVEILQQGGNAIDAAIAVAFALEVVYPVAGNIGGGGFIVHRTAAGEVAALDYREAAPSNASRDMYVDSAGNVTDKSRIGHLAAGVPGSVAGLHAAWKRYGSLPWATLLAPAIRLAQGHVIDTERSRNIAADRELLAQFPASRTQFLPGDSAPPPGTVWRQPDLARTLQLISDSGPDVFYRGQVADLGRTTCTSWPRRCGAGSSTATAGWATPTSWTCPSTGCSPSRTRRRCGRRSIPGTRLPPRQRRAVTG